MSNAYVLARRQIVLNAGRATVALAAIGLAPSSAAAAPSAPAGALKELADRLASAPRRRNFKTVPLILTEHRDWDHEAAAEVMAYRFKSRQVWDNSDLSGPWPGLMRESMNGHAFALGYSDFLAVSATHGEAHLALFSQGIWDRYNLADLVGRKFASNTLIVEHDGVSPSDDLQNPQGFYGPMNNNIVSLQRRGAVFIACHDTIHYFARKLAGMAEFAERSADEIAADLTNNLVPGAVLVPSVVAYLVELQRSGFTYVNAG